MLEHLESLFDAISTVASEIITISEIAKEVVDNYNQKNKKENEDQGLHDPTYKNEEDPYLDTSGDILIPDNIEEITDIEGVIDVHVGEKNSEIKEYLITNLWSIPQLLLHYGITNSDIDEIISPFERSFRRVNKIGLVDSAKLPLIYNHMYERFPLSELVKMGIYTNDGLLKINPVDILYTKKERSPAELAEEELIRNSDFLISDVSGSATDGDYDVCDIKYATALTMIASNKVQTEKDMEYLEKLIQGLDFNRENIIRTYIETKKASM